MIGFMGFPGRDGIRSFFSSTRKCQKSQEIAKHFEKLQKVVAFVGFLVEMEFNRCFQFCSKLSEIVRNFEKHQKVIDFVGFPGRDGIQSFFSSTRNC